MVQLITINIYTGPQKNEFRIRRHRCINCNGRQRRSVSSSPTTPLRSEFRVVLKFVARAILMVGTAHLDVSVRQEVACPIGCGSNH